MLQRIEKSSREKRREVGLLKVGGEPNAKKEEVRTYDVEIAKIQGGGGLNVKLIKWKIVNIEFNHHDPIPFDYQGP